MHISRYALGLAVIVFGSLALAQPKTMPDYSAIGVTEPGQGGTLTLSIADAPQTFLYYGAIDANHQTINLQMFDALVEYNLETYEIEPALATSWEVSDDGLVWTFNLRQGVVWHDGEPFTAADVKFTYEQIVMNPDTLAGDVTEFVVNGVATQWNVIDDHTLEVVLPVASPVFLQTIRKPIMPRHKLLEFSIEGGAEPDEINNAWSVDADPSDIVGTGAFRLVSYTPGQLVTLERNPDYWKEDASGNALPYLDSLRYLVVRGGEARTAQFLAGNIDVLNISGAQFPDLRERELAGEPIVTVRSAALFGSPPHLAFNFDAPDSELAEIFSNTEFRRAMEQAVDRERIIDVVYNGLASLPGTPTAPADGTFYRDTTGIMRSFDLEAAAAALAELEIENLEFTLTYNQDSPVFTDIATILQNDFGQLGVQVNLQGIPGNALFSTALSGDFDAILVAFGNLPDPELRRPIWQPGGDLYYWHTSLQTDLSGMFAWEEEIYDLLELGARTLDLDERVEIYGRWQEINADYLPVIMIAKGENIAAVRDNVGNFVYDLGVIPGYNPVIFYTAE